MAHAEPVVVTSSGSLPDLVVPGVTGYVLPPGDLPALGEKLALLCRHPDLCVEMGRAAQRLARERVTWDAAAERGLQLYHQVLGGST
jgi:glycosyltransferase involved in cell wall biosynthesis